MIIITIIIIIIIIIVIVIVIVGTTKENERLTVNFLASVKEEARQALKSLYKHKLQKDDS